MSVSEKGSIARLGEKVCIFEGDITNFKTVREKLSDMGVQAEENFASAFLNVYNTMGARGEAIVFGEFSAVIWDGERKKLLLFRDKAGVHPLYYAFKNNRFAFSSSIKALLRFPGVYPVVNKAALAELFGNCGMVNPCSTPFEDIKRVPPGCVVEFSRDGVRVKSYYSINPSDKFNSEFIAKDAIRIRGGERICCKKEPDPLQLVFSALDMVDYVGFPVYMPVYFVTELLKEQKAEEIYIPFLPPEINAPDLRTLLNEKNISGIDTKLGDKNSMAEYETKTNVYFDDEMKVRAAGKIKLKINTLYALWGEVLARFGQYTGKKAVLPLADARFLECVTDGGGNEYIYKGRIFLPDCDFVRNILVNELGKGERPLYKFLDKKKLWEFINNTEDVLSLLYILQTDYWCLKYRLELNMQDGIIAKGLYL